MNRWVVGFAFGHDRDRGGRALIPCRVLLIDKIRGPVHLRGHLNGLGGAVENDETIVQAMVREFREECGSETRAVDWEIFAVSEAKWGSIHFLRHFEDLERLQIWEKSPTDEQVRWCDLNDRRPVGSGHGWAPELHWLIPLSLDPGTCREHAHPCIEFPLYFKSLSSDPTKGHK